MNSNLISYYDRFSFALHRYTKHFFGINTNSNYLRESILKKISTNRLGKKIEIDRIKNFSNQFFFENYLKKNKPVIFKGMAKNWDCVKKWDLDNIKEKYGNDIIPVMDTISGGVNSIYNVETTTLSEVIDAMKIGDDSKYIRFNNLLHAHPELIKDFDTEKIFSMRSDFASGNTFQCFMGAKGTKTELHAAISHNLFTQVKGVKEWRLYNSSFDPFLRPPVNGRPYFFTEFDPLKPDYDRFPEVKYLDYYHFDLEEGDVLYNPSSFWHHVVNKTATIGVGFRWFAPDSIKLNFSQVLLTITAKNPSVFYVLRNKRNYSKIFEHIANNSKFKIN